MCWCQCKRLFKMTWCCCWSQVMRCRRRGASVTSAATHGPQQHWSHWATLCCYNTVVTIIRTVECDSVCRHWPRTDSCTGWTHASPLPLPPSSPSITNHPSWLPRISHLVIHSHTLFTVHSDTITFIHWFLLSLYHRLLVSPHMMMSSFKMFTF